MGKYVMNIYIIISESSNCSNKLKHHGYQKIKLKNFFIICEKNLLLELLMSKSNKKRGICLTKERHQSHLTILFLMSK